jgi:accessory gene regulator protein AgrB
VIEQGKLKKKKKESVIVLVLLFKILRLIGFPLLSDFSGFS